MSKTVIVFSTRYIHPLVKNGIFSEGHYHRKPFKSNKLANFFWDRIEVQRKKAILNEMVFTEKYFKIEKLKELPEAIELLSCLNDNKEYINTYIQTHKLDISYDTDGFEWITVLLKQMRTDDSSDQTIKESLSEKFKKYKNCLLQDDEHLLWICENLRDDIEQEPFSIFNGDSNRREPWVAYRFSYYELQNNTNDVKVYAVWPLSVPNSKDDDGNYQWVDALSKQFLSKELGNDDATDLYLILHDKDIERSIFKVIIDDMTDNASRHVALFQHIDAIGAFLEKTNTDCVESIKKFVERMVISDRKRQLICDAYDYITSPKPEKNKDLQSAVTNLIKLDSNRFKQISEISNNIQNLENKSLFELLDKEKLRLISELNKQLKNALTYDI